MTPPRSAGDPPSISPAKAILWGIGFLVISGGLVAALLVFGSDGESDEGADGTGMPGAVVVADWEDLSLSTLCIEGEEDYGSGPNAVTPVRAGLTALLGDLVVDEGCEATITISLQGEARSATYTNPDSPGAQLVLYSGAEIRGTISLTTEGRDPLTMPLGGSVSPPQTIGETAGAPRAPLGAPFWGAAYRNVCWVLQGWFGADDPTLSGCPRFGSETCSEVEVPTFTTTAGHQPWPEALREEYLDDCMDGTPPECLAECRCLLDATASVLTEAEWLSIRDVFNIDDWPPDIAERLLPLWRSCSP